MHQPESDRHSHVHVFDAGSAAAERGTRLVTWITLVMMVVEIAAGWWFNSMALLADGWHMSSHAVAIGLSAVAYATARRYARDPRFAFGTWKVEILGGFASALFLLAVAVAMVVASAERLLAPQAIHYPEALAIAVLGLVVNLVCALILGKAGRHDHDHGPGHDHDRGPGREHGHGHGPAHDHASHAAQRLAAQPARTAAAPASAASHHDLNLKSAYLHVLADAATSVFAILALAGGWLAGWAWLDPVTGLAGAVLVAAWARGLLGATGKILLDREMDHPVVDEIRACIEQDDARVTDLHVWRVGKKVYSCAMTVETGDPALTPTRIRERLAGHAEIVHSTIEVHLRTHGVA